MAAGQRSRTGGRWLRGFLIVILPPALYFFVYVQQRVDAAGRHAYGVLSAITTEMQSRIEANREIVKRTDHEASDACAIAPLTDSSTALERNLPANSLVER